MSETSGTRNALSQQIPNRPYSEESMEEKDKSAKKQSKKENIYFNILGIYVELHVINNVQDFPILNSSRLTFFLS